MKKILFLITSLGGGGAERVLINLVNSLDKSKYDITVQTMFNVGVNRTYLDKSIKYIPGFQKQFRGNSQLQKILPRKLLYRFLIREKYDVIVSYLEGPPARVLSGCPYNDTKKITWIHVEQENKKRASRVFRTYREAQKSYSAFDRIICVSRKVQEDFTAIFGLEEKTEVLYNTNNTKEIIEKSKQQVCDVELSREVNVFSVGRLEKQKGYDRLINVHRRLLQEGVNHHIYILGVGSLEKELKQQCVDLEVSDTFHFLGYKSNPYAYLARADMFICSSRREGFSTAVTESLVLGIPCVSTRCSGAEELLGEHNEYGLVVENSEEGIYLGLKEMLTHVSERENYAERAKKRGEQFSTEKTVQKVDDLLENILNE